MKTITNGKGFITPILAVILSAVILLGVAVSGFSDQMSLASRYDWCVAQARSAADTGIERAKAKLLENPMWENGSEAAGSIDPNVPDARVDSVDVNQESLTVNQDGSITRVVTVTSTGSSGGGADKVSKTVQAKLAVNMPVPDGGGGGGGNGENGGGGGNNWDVGWLLALNDISLETFKVPLLSENQILTLTSGSSGSETPHYSLSTATFGTPYSSIVGVNNASEAFYITNIISDAAAANFANQAIQNKNFATALNALWNYSMTAFEASLDNLATAGKILTDSLQGLLDPIDAMLKHSEAMQAFTTNALSELNSSLLMTNVNLASLTDSINATTTSLISGYGGYNTNYNWNNPSYNSWDYGYSSYNYSSPSYSYSYSYSTPSYSSWNYGWNSYSYNSWNSYSYSSWSWW